MSNPNLNVPSLDPGSGTFGRRHSAKNIGVAPSIAGSPFTGCASAPWSSSSRNDSVA